MIIVKINSFDPLNIEFPLEAVTGRFKLVLPNIQMKLFDLSMGGMIPQAPYVGAEGQVFSLDIDIGESEMSGAKVMEFIQECLPQLRDMHKLVQGGFAKQFLLGKD